MEVPRLGVKLELQPLAYTTATAMWDLSYVCDLHHSSQQHQILNPPSEARDGTCILMDTSQVHFRWATTETLNLVSFYSFRFRLRPQERAAVGRYAGLKDALGRRNSGRKEQLQRKCQFKGCWFQDLAGYQNARMVKSHSWPPYPRACIFHFNQHRTVWHCMY